MRGAASNAILTLDEPKGLAVPPGPLQTGHNGRANGGNRRSHWPTPIQVVAWSPDHAIPPTAGLPNPPINGSHWPRPIHSCRRADIPVCLIVQCPPGTAWCPHTCSDGTRCKCPCQSDHSQTSGSSARQLQTFDVEVHWFPVLPPLAERDVVNC